MKQVIPETSPEFDSARLIERPDGFYWQSRSGTEEFGPFASLLAAVQDMQAREESGPEPGETVQEAEAEIGISDWTDPETGEPAEESVPRLEEH
ncbi:MAG TPA: hypothetical protein VLV56_03270 [Burkholderiales bacterium]|nr:hypothetical protein [Burkholderiales bacterium]